MERCLHASLVLCLLVAPMPARAAQELPVDLRLDTGPRLAAEKALKALLDEWATSAFDVRFAARPEADFATPGRVRIRLDGFALAFNPAWYRRYKAFHDQLRARPFAPDVLAHGLAYCRQGDARLRATLLDAGGKPLWTGEVWHTRAPSHYAPIEQHFFPPRLARELPKDPPDLRQLWDVPPGEAPYVVVPVEAFKAVRRIRIGDMADRRWPIDLRDPLAPPPSPPPAPPASPAAAPAAPPASPDAAPRLPPPSLPSP